jgi:hypothetical protein
VGAISLQADLSAAAQREWHQRAKSGLVIQGEAGQEEWRWLASLLETEEEGDDVLNTAKPDVDDGSDGEEYFPGSDMMTEQAPVDLRTVVTELCELKGDGC